MAFARFPEETLIQIFEQLPQQTLAKLSPCTKRIHRVVEPMLYSSFSNESKAGFDNLVPFVRTIANDPLKSRFVKEIVVNTHWSGPNPTRHLTKDDESRICAIAGHVTRTTLGAVGHCSWNINGDDDNRRGDGKGVERPDAYHQIPIIYDLIAYAGFEEHTRPSLLKKLSSVELKSISRCPTYLPGLMLDLKTINTVIIEEFNGMLRRPKIPATWIKSLHIGCAEKANQLDYLHEGHQLDFVREQLGTYFPALEHLYFKGAIPLAHVRHGCTHAFVGCFCLDKAFAPLKPTLKSLTLHDTQSSVSEAIGAFLSLQDFHQLHTVNITAELLIGLDISNNKPGKAIIDRLPRDLSHLTLRRASSCTIQQVMEIPRQSYWFPSLKSVELQLHMLFPGTPIMVEVLEPLKDALAARSVFLMVCLDDADTLVRKGNDLRRWQKDEPWAYEQMRKAQMA